MIQREDLSGQHFGRWRVLNYSHTLRRGPTDNLYLSYWLCRCQCGREKTIYGATLKAGGSKSCGICIARNHSRRRPGGGWFIHRLSHTPEYIVWYHMKRRCSDPKHPGYKNYGGRGITVCEQWQDVHNFIADMGLRPTPKHTLERINNDQGYEPENCKWATRTEQARNSRQVCLLTWKGKTQTVAQWARETGKSKQTIRRRMLDNWTPEQIFTLPVKPCHRAKASHAQPTTALAHSAKQSHQSSE